MAPNLGRLFLKRWIWFLATAGMLLMAGAAAAVTEADVQAPLVSDGAVPEPGILALVGMGLAVMAVLLRRKKGA